MKWCLLSILITLTNGNQNLPKFTLIEERSDNGSPSVMITFPNGLDDKLILNKYYLNEEQEQLGAEHCNFVGHLENDLDACVALTGCPGLDEFVELTIMSDHLTASSFKWRKNGQVEVNKLSGLPHLAHERAGENNENDLLPESHEQETLEFAIAEFCWNGWGWSCPKNPSRPGGGGGSRPKPDQKTHILHYKIRYDDNFKARNYHYQLNPVMTHVQARVCHHTLGQKYQLRLVDYKHLPGQRWPNSFMHIKNMAGQAQRDVGSAQLVIYMGVADANACGSSCIGGEAWRGTMCNNHKGNYCQMNYWSWAGMSDFAHGVTHELGHFLGASHDTGNNCGNDKGIEGGNPDRWSACSRRDIQAHYTAYKNRWCMSAAPSACSGVGR